MLKKLAFATISMVLLATIQPASAQDSFVLERIKERGTINMGHREASVPFAYLKDGSVQGYSIDLCDLFVEKIKKTLEMPDLKVKHVPVTSQTRLALIANGNIDMECGSTTNNLTRQKQVDRRRVLVLVPFFLWDTSAAVMVFFPDPPLTRDQRN